LILIDLQYKSATQGTVNRIPYAGLIKFLFVFFFSAALLQLSFGCVTHLYGLYFYWAICNWFI